MGDVLGAAGAPAGEPGAAVGDGAGAVPLYPILRDFPPLPPLREALELPPRGPVRAAVAGDDGAGAPPAAGDDDDGGAVLPGLSDDDGDAALVGGARSAIEADLIKEAVNPMDDGWARIQAAITAGDIPDDRIKGVLSEVLRGLAMWGFPNIKAFINKKFNVGGGATISVDVNYRGDYGETALMQAAANGRLEGVKILVQEGADPNIQNNDGESALMWAAAYNEVPVITLLLVEGAKPNLTDKQGWTALMVAGWAGNIEAVRELLPKSKLDISNKDDQTAKDLAAVDGSPAKGKGVQVQIRDILTPASKPSIWSRITGKNKKGGKHRTQRRKKTNSKKRSRR
jgi:hypothetical protein